MSVRSAEHGGLSPVPSRHREPGQTNNRRLMAGVLAGALGLAAVGGIFELTQTQKNSDNSQPSPVPTLPGEAGQASPSQSNSEIFLPEETPKQTPFIAEHNPSATFGHGMDQLFTTEGMTDEQAARVEGLKFWLQMVNSQETSFPTKDGSGEIKVKIDSNAMGTFGDEIPNILTGFSQSPLVINYDYTSITPDENGKASGQRNTGKTTITEIEESVFTPIELSDQAKADGVEIAGSVDITEKQNYAYNVYETASETFIDQQQLEQYFAKKADLSKDTGEAKSTITIRLYKQNGEWHFGPYPQSPAMVADFNIAPEVNILINQGCDANQNASYCQSQTITHLP